MYYVVVATVFPELPEPTQGNRRLVACGSVLVHALALALCLVAGPPGIAPGRLPEPAQPSTGAPPSSATRTSTGLRSAASTRASDPRRPAPERPAIAGDRESRRCPNRARVVEAAERWLGTEYVLGGRAGRRGCRRDGRRVRCPDGVDCQSLIFFAYEEVFGVPWTRFSVMPSVSVRRRLLGRPTPGLGGVLRSALKPDRLRPGDVLFFLAEGYNLEADSPLLVQDGLRYGVWHTGLVHHVEGGQVFVIHARPGDEVVIQPLDDVWFDGLYVLRKPC